MGKKMLVALMMEGKFSGEGLQALDTDEDLMSAMARELVEKAGIGESADAVWRELGGERDKMLPGNHEPEAELETEPIRVLATADQPLAATLPTTFGVPLLEPNTSTRKRKKVPFWPTTKEASVQLSLFD
jgi:hypothetical protein